MTKYYISLFISILSNSASLILLKKGMLAESDFGNNVTSINSWISLISNWNIVSAVLLFGISFITWMYALIKIDLSLAYPTVSLSYILIAVSSFLLFQEQITIYRGLGIAIIMVGIAVMYLK